MNMKERDELVMRHLERAYRACSIGDSKAQGKSSGDSEVASAIVDTIILLKTRTDTPTTI